MATTATPRIRHALGRTVRANLPVAELYEDAIRHGEGLVAADGPLVVRTGKHTGRSPEDKFIVAEPSSEAKVWWGPVNRPISEADYERLRARLVAYCEDRDLYSQDCFIGAAE
ncbi:MAG TPA: phosphoenolpyruvate carboxykinase (ATP), partial [Candidatus Limnocylindrales bacterium]